MHHPSKFPPASSWIQRRHVKNHGFQRRRHTSAITPVWHSDRYGDLFGHRAAQQEFTQCRNGDWRADGASGRINRDSRESWCSTGGEAGQTFMHQTTSQKAIFYVTPRSEPRGGRRSTYGDSDDERAKRSAVPET